MILSDEKLLMRSVTNVLWGLKQSDAGRNSVPLYLSLLHFGQNMCQISLLFLTGSVIETAGFSYQTGSKIRQEIKTAFFQMPFELYPFDAD